MPDRTTDPGLALLPRTLSTVDGEVILRTALAADRRAIVALVWTLGLNPHGLAWHRFVVAEARGRVVGIGQVKPHSDGSRELASIGVVREQRGLGIARAIIEALLATERPNVPLYLICRPDKVPFYARFGFQRIPVAEMPPHFRLLARLIAGTEHFLAFFGRRTSLGAILRR